MKLTTGTRTWFDRLTKTRSGLGHPELVEGLQSLLAIAFITLLFSACEFKSSGYHITGTIKNLPPGGKITLEELAYTSTIPLDTTHADKDGHFELNGYLKHEGLYRLLFENKNFVILVLNEKKQRIDIKGDASGSFLQQAFTIKGSPLSNQVQNLMLNEISRNTAMAELFDKMNDSIHPPGDSVKAIYKAAMDKQSSDALNYLTTYIDTVTDPVIGIFAAYYYLDPRMNLPTLIKLANKLQKNSPELPISKSFIENVAQLVKEANPSTDQPTFTNGKELPEIEMNDVNGNPLKLSSLRGNYVLVDFWASWCGPCRAENPNVVKAYNDFKDKGFTIFSVSLDDDHGKWVAAIAKDKLAWPSHVSELKGWRSDICQQFGITGIPTNYLIDKEGKVIASDLRGNELENILQQTLK